MDHLIGNPAPRVSVVIPAYNQAHFLDDAIQSALAQTYRDFEIVVVNDGSTDDTETVAQRYQDQIRYLYQQNQGLAGARNTGILAARGEYVALLDSDDIWDPAFLAEMMALAEREPAATVYCCGIRYMDGKGQDLPQRGGTEVTEPGKFYWKLLRANSLIPSTILMKRAPVVEANLFDISFRRLQDWELWIRLLRSGHTFAGLKDHLVRYRVHGSNLSTDPVGGQQAARALIEKHFGADDGNWASWTEDKRRAFGGLYRYCLLSSVQRQEDWQSGVGFLQRALQADPTLADDLDLFYDLALGDQPAGYRGTTEKLCLKENGERMQHLLAGLFASAPTIVQSLRSAVCGTAFKAVGLAAYNTGQFALCRKYLWMALRARPALLRETWLVKNLLKSFLGRDGVALLRSLRGKDRQAAINKKIGQEQ